MNIHKIANSARDCAADAPDAWLDQLSPDELLDIACPEPSEPEPITHEGPTGAIRLLARLTEKGHKIPPALEGAAALERYGLDALKSGHPIVANAFFRAADRRIERQAEAKRQRRGAA